MAALRMRGRSDPATCISPPDHRMGREWETVQAMVGIYCRHHHGPDLCAECRGLLDYARKRLERCVFGSEKPTCAKCPVHCYQRQHRDRIRTVMRFAGPRMIWRHPWLAAMHVLDNRFRKAPSRVP